jgi:hypothetical protein
LAAQCKNGLEEGQRCRRKEREDRGEEWSPRWFNLTTDPVTGRQEYIYNGKYFKAQAEGNWADAPDLYSCASSTSPEFGKSKSSSSQF